MDLSHLSHFYLDLQTTGAKPSQASIVEMALLNPHSSCEHFLVEQPGHQEIPCRIQMITGITNEDMKKALPFAHAMEKLVRYIEDYPVAIIHFAQFEKPFLEAALHTIDRSLPLKIICTHEIAKRLFPNLPSRGIKGLAGFFGYAGSEFKRASCHAEATRVIWEKLLPLLKERSIHTLEELETWLESTPKAVRTKYEYPLPKEKRLNLPDVPGIYRMLNFKGDVLYVGKATSLKSRVNSYFRGQKGRDSKKLEMLAQVQDLRVTPCVTPLESALLETDEIKKLNPPYNISLKMKGRSLAFFDRDFISVSSICDDLHSIGPFSNALVFESMMTFSTYLREQGDGLLPDENTFFEPLDPQLIQEGFELFCLEKKLSPERFRSMRSIIAQGILWYRIKIKEKVEKEGEIEEDDELENHEEEMEETPLTPLDIALKFERHFIRAGESYLRAKKLKRLLNADIHFHHPSYPERDIKIRNGHLSSEEKIGINNSWSNHSIETYDRLTVLLTELERVRSYNGHYQISYCCNRA